MTRKRCCCTEPSSSSSVPSSGVPSSGVPSSSAPSASSSSSALGDPCDCDPEGTAQVAIKLVIEVDVDSTGWYFINSGSNSEGDKTAACVGPAWASYARSRSEKSENYQSAAGTYLIPLTFNELCTNAIKPPEIIQNGSVTGYRFTDSEEFNTGYGGGQDIGCVVTKPNSFVVYMQVQPGGNRFYTFELYFFSLAAGMVAIPPPICGDPDMYTTEVVDEMVFVPDPSGVITIPWRTKLSYVKI